MDTTRFHCQTDDTNEMTVELSSVEQVMIEMNVKIDMLGRQRSFIVLNELTEITGTTSSSLRN